MGFISRGFKGKRRDNVSSSRVPPGQHVVKGDILADGPLPTKRLLAVAVQTGIISMSLSGPIE